MSEHDFEHRLGNLAAHIRWGQDSAPELPDDQVELHKWLKGQKSRYAGGNMPDAQRLSFARAGLFALLEPEPEDDPGLEARLVGLQRYIERHGWDAVECMDGIVDPQTAPLRRWLGRIERRYRGRPLDPCLQERFAYLGVRLDKTRPVSLVATMSIRVFLDKLAILEEALQEAERYHRVRDLRHANCLRSKNVMAAIHFIEHLAFKARNGILADPHRQRVIALRFSVDGQDIRELLATRSRLCGDAEPELRAPAARRQKMNAPHLGGLRRGVRKPGMAIPPDAQ